MPCIPCSAPSEQPFPCRRTAVAFEGEWTSTEPPGRTWQTERVPRRQSNDGTFNGFICVMKCFILVTRHWRCTDGQRATLFRDYLKAAPFFFIRTIIDNTNIFLTFFIGQFNCTAVAAACGCDVTVGLTFPKRFTSVWAGGFRDPQGATFGSPGLQTP